MQNKTELDLIEEKINKYVESVLYIDDTDVNKIMLIYRKEITKLLDGIVAEVDKKKIAGGNYNCGEEGCCNTNPDDKRELEDVDFQCGYNQAIQDFIQIIKSKI